MPIKPTHVFRNDERSRRRILAEVHPLLDISTTEGRFLLQDGEILTPNGEPMKPVPDWVKTELDKIPADVLAMHGLERKQPEPEPAPPAARKPRKPRAAKPAPEPETVGEQQEEAPPEVPQPSVAAQ